MRPSSARAKGRRLEKLVAQKVQEYLGLGELDVRCNIGAANGMDLIMSEKAADMFPFAVECKNVEKPELPWRWWDQTNAHVTDRFHIPLLVWSRNRAKPLAILDLDDFMKMVKHCEETGYYKR